ncbi:hypothetical protein FAA97_02430 [Peteryoungia ipomoeae]|uniref:Uncharacterized protein n=1 Tax=Peteryoungia ipomoeae TaxID=1210932 RepID=A0A4S8P4Q4_9HYPH|nr:hypothetical protein FAA97_02430 [Peteryoungia ipomoeae]
MENTTVRRGLSKNVEGLTELLRRIEALRDVRGEMPLQMVSVFLVIAMKPGILQRDLPEIVNLSQSSVSRNVHALSASDGQGKPGLGLVEQRIGSSVEELRPCTRQRQGRNWLAGSCNAAPGALHWQLRCLILVAHQG